MLHAKEASCAICCSDGLEGRILKLIPEKEKRKRKTFSRDMQGEKRKRKSEVTAEAERGR